jgi:hypothetical protein
MTGGVQEKQKVLHQQSTHKPAITDLLRTHDTARANIEELILAYNAAVCHEIYAKMYTKLPRELRDMIYPYLFTGRRIVVNDRYANRYEEHRFSMSYSGILCPRTFLTRQEPPATSCAVRRSGTGTHR